ncbi:MULTISPECIES: ABC transporter permease [Paenibacillus]|jgi:putative ABC transport system permease protein|uniref:ABC transport system permease protein n=1 Tax=Paenibacillus barengoltzii J12 TaxID=935846 RepID=A0ABY1LVI2_9BACL|nr:MULTISPECIES: ABC transporter permease [Paenibacillus]MEC2346117.1 ABC transporter permease [Paenibacillus barengoltzii]SMF12961.1 putative ABC transport system permease protein [Paenibacillus barengoltzii J12]
MSIWESILVALDNLRMNKLRSFLTMIGIVFGVAAVVTVVSIGQAGQSSIMSEMSNYEDGYFLIYPNYSNGEPEDNVYFRQREMAEIRKLPGVRYVSSSSSYGMTGKLKKEELQFSITGTTSDSPKMQKIDLVAGRFFNSQEERARQKILVVEAKYANKAFGSPQGAIGRKIQLSGGMFRIVGVYKVQESLMSGFGGERYSAYAPITTMLDVEGSSDRLSMLEILPTSPERMDETVASVKAWLADRKNVSKDAYVSESARDAEQMIKSTFSILQTIIGSIAGISLLVGGIGVMNIMLVSVTERTREIGIRKAIGATPGTIMLQFMIEAIILSFIGGTIGALFGLLAAWVFALISGWPFVISIWAILLAFGFSAAVGIFFGLYPANKASKLHPIESLRYE